MGRVPSEKEMRRLARSLARTAEKLGGSFKIRNLDEAAGAVAYLFGYSSWNEYLRASSCSHGSSSYAARLPKFKERRSASGSFFQNRGYSPKEISEVRKSPISHPERLIGKRAKDGKSSEPFGLALEDYFVSGSGKVSEDFFVDSVRRLIENRQSVFVFGGSGRLVSTQSRSFDPLRDLFEGDGDGAKEYFSVAGGGEFADLWLKILVSASKFYGRVWSADDLKSSLSLGSLLGIRRDLSAFDDGLSKALDGYLARCGQRESNDGAILSIESQNRHYAMSYGLSERAERTARLYEEGLFLTGGDGLGNVLSNKESAEFGDSDSHSEEYWDLLACAHGAALDAHDEKIRNYDGLAYKSWALWKNPEGKSPEFAASRIGRGTSATFGFHCETGGAAFSKIVERSYQGLFLRQNGLDYEDSMVSSFMERTSVFDRNIWFDGCSALSEMAAEEAYAWKRIDRFAPKGLSGMGLNKIVLYSDVETKRGDVK